LRLIGKKALVTGGGFGIGKAISLAFAREGADVAIASRNRANLKETTREIESLGRRGLAITTDIAYEDQIEEMVQATLQDFGQIDVLVNNSGIAGAVRDVAEVDLKDWERVMAVNLTGAMLCSREVLKHMIPRREGNIINISSMAGRRGVPQRSPYVVSKWGMHGLTHTLAIEVGPHNIRVNCICPGATEGERIERVMQRVSESTGEPYESGSPGADGKSRGGGRVRRLPGLRRVQRNDEPDHRGGCGQLETCSHKGPRLPLSCDFLTWPSALERRRDEAGFQSARLCSSDDSRTLVSHPPIPYVIW